MNIGAQLRASREAKGISIEVISRTTRVQPRIIAAIEQNDLRAVPPRPFGRGFVRAYAREVGLDPDQTARAYFAQFAAASDVRPAPLAHETVTSAPRTRRSWAWAAAIASGMVVVIATVFWSRLGARPATTQASAVVGTTGLVNGGAPSAESTATAPPEAAPLPPPAPVQAADPLTIVLDARRTCWVTATVDGRRAIFRTLPAGARETLRAEREIMIRAGDAGAVAWSINGRTAEALGQDGQIRTVHVTPQNAATIR
jgi:cytoskeleton protein RodZ